MKLNWGNALLIFFILYISLLVRIVVKSFGVDHTLVVENYYDHDIAYQEKYDKVENRNLLSTDLSISLNQSKETLNLNFGPEASILEAKVELYRASDSKSDLSKNLKNIQKEAEIDIRSLKRGMWKVKVEWRDEVRTYFKEEDFYI